MFGSSAGGKKFDSQEYRDKLDDVNLQFQKLYATHTAKMAEYEKMSKTQLADLLGSSAPAAAQMYSQAEGIGDIYSSQSLPAYSKYIKDAMEYDTPERRAAAREGAMADVDSATASARRDAAAKLESYGIDPSQTRSGALDANLAVDAALQKVKAAQDAEQQIEDTGHQRMTDALSASDQLAARQVDLNQAATNIKTNNLSAVNSTAATYSNIIGTGKSILDSEAGIANSQAALKQAEQMSKGGGGANYAAIGTAIGTVAGGIVGTYVAPGVGTAAGMSMGGALGGAAGSAASG